MLREDAALRAQASSVVVAFLGDNIYPAGLREPEHEGRGRDEIAIDRQLAVVRGIRARGLFVPGNHDWAGGGERGLASIQRQGEYVKGAASEALDVVYAPQAGCPGPTAIGVGSTVLLIVLDTEWLLRYRQAPAGLECAHSSAGEVGRALESILVDSAGPGNRHAIVLAHHPLKTNGPHGGYFGLTDQLFPLRNLWKPLYIPIPFIYAIGRNSGVSSQDMSSSNNRRVRNLIEQSLARSDEQPLVYGAGHEHALEVFTGGRSGAEYLLVSGAGSKARAVERGDALFVSGKGKGELGYMRLEFFKDGSALLSVITDGAADCSDSETDCLRPKVRYWRWLTDPV